MGIMTMVALRAHAYGLALVGLSSSGAPVGAPTITSATASIDSITVSWSAVPGAVSYNIYDALNGAPTGSNSIDSNSSSSTSLTFTPSSLGVQLDIAVTSLDASGEESNDSEIRKISTLVTTAT